MSEKNTPPPLKYLKVVRKIIVIYRIVFKSAFPFFFILRLVKKNVILYVHDFSVWLKTGFNPTDIYRFECPTGHIVP